MTGRKSEFYLTVTEVQSCLEGPTHSGSEGEARSRAETTRGDGDDRIDGINCQQRSFQLLVFRTVGERLF